MNDLFDWNPDGEPKAPTPRERREASSSVSASRRKPAAPTASPCRLIPFPLAARTGKVRKAAQTLEARVTDEGKSAFWNRTVRALRDELARRGCNLPEIERQVADFHDAVSAELTRQAHRHRDEGRA